MEILESKNTVAKMKNSLERYNTTFEVVEERISEIEDIDMFNNVPCISEALFIFLYYF